MEDLSRRSIFTEEDVHLLRLRKICSTVCTDVMHLVFREGTRRRPAGMSLLEFYQRNGLAVDEFKRTLEPEELKKVTEDPKGDSFDITLLYKCIKWGNDKVAYRRNCNWREGSDFLESYLTALNNVRDTILDEDHIYNEQQFLKQTEDIRRILTKILRFAGSRYRIPRKDVEKRIEKMHKSISTYVHAPIMPLDSLFQKQWPYSESVEIVKRSKMKNLRPFCKRLISFSPLPEEADLIFNVNDVYTEPIMIKSYPGEAEDTSLNYKDFLKGVEQCFTSPVILLEGLPGMGKTTLIRKIISDWLAGKSTMDKLRDYDFVLYASCNNLNISSFDEMVNSIMPDLAETLKDKDFSYVILSQKVLVIIDGIDEWNATSSQLFQEIIQMKRTRSMTVVVTMRPVNLTTYYSFTISHQVKTKHIKICGVPRERREQFVKRYHQEIIKRSSDKQKICDLLDYLKRMDNLLGDLLVLPEILTVITIFWTKNSQLYNIFASSSALFREILQRILSKLLHRFQNYECVKGIDESALRKKIDYFLSVIGDIALRCMQNDIISLSEEYHKELVNVCLREGLPAEEVIGAFLDTKLRFRILGPLSNYSFPFKYMRNFLAAFALFKELVKNNVVTGGNEADELDFSMRCHNAHSHIARSMANSVSDYRSINSKNTTIASTGNKHTQVATVIRGFLHNFSMPSPVDVSKIQDMLIFLMGLLNVENDNVSSDLKLEVLTLMEESGIIVSDDWYRILALSGCDAFSASFLNEKLGVLQGDIEIDDANLFGYINLLKALKPPLKCHDKISVEVNIRECVSGISELVKVVRSHQLRLETVIINDDNVATFISVMKPLQANLKTSELLDIDLILLKNTASLDELMSVIKKNKVQIKKILITDENYVGYISLLKVSSHIRNSTNLELVVDIHEDSSDIRELMIQIKEIPCCIKRLSHRSGYLRPKVDASLDNAINEAFNRCSVESYEGKVNPDMVFPSTIKTLYVSVLDANSYVALNQFLQSKPRLSRLGINVTLDINPLVLHPLPRPYINPPSLILPDVKHEDEICKAAQIAKQLLPIEDDKQFYHIYFPRSRMSKHKIKKLIRELSGVSVFWSLVFPSSGRPSSLQEEEDLAMLAKSELNCLGRGVEWDEYYGLEERK